MVHGVNESVVGATEVQEGPVGGGIQGVGGGERAADPVNQQAVCYGPLVCRETLVAGSVVRRVGAAHVQQVAVGLWVGGVVDRGLSSDAVADEAFRRAHVRALPRIAVGGGWQHMSRVAGEAVVGVDVADIDQRALRGGVGRVRDGLLGGQARVIAQQAVCDSSLLRGKLRRQRCGRCQPWGERCRCGG